MLIRSPRHTPEDLDWWAEAEAADYLLGRKLEEGVRPRRAIEEMKIFAQQGPCYVSVSWGKDSTVLAHLAVRSGLPLSLVHLSVRTIHRDQEIDIVRDCFLEKYGHLIKYIQININPTGKEQRETGHCPELDQGIREAAARLGTARYIGGVRAAESGGRRIRMRQHGIHTAQTCQPLGWWSAAEIFGYLAYHGLPVHPAYGMTRGGVWPREQIRVSILGGKKGTSMGRREWEEEYYPDQLRRLEVAQALGHLDV